MITEIKKAVSLFLILMLSVGFLGVSMLKLVPYPDVAATFERWGIPKVIMIMIGIIELMIGIFLFYPPTRKKSAFAGVILIIGAGIMHIVKSEINHIYGPLIVLSLLLGLIYSDNLYLRKQ